MKDASLSQLPLSEDPSDVLACLAGDGDGLAVSVHPIPSHAERPHDTHPTSRIFVAQEGRGQRRYEQGGRTLTLQTAPRMIEMYEAGLSFDHCLWEGTPGRCVMVEFTDAGMKHLTHGVLSSLPLPTKHELFDTQLSTLALDLAEEALRGWPNGKLYYHGLCVSLVGVLSHRYVGQARCIDTVRPTRLAHREQQRVLDLIEAELGNDLSLSRLATQAGLSPYHFARVFKESFGITPHKYVQRRRLEAAAVALQHEPGRSIADISLGLGFSSQAHMTQLMRMHFGVTPGSMRRK
ncbi:MAG: AraC family transcriptional regulator [Hydrogenophaga sp.]|nr:AraC family transcriptional regulator [Hydrogenophaga sp.]